MNRCAGRSYNTEAEQRVQKLSTMSTKLQMDLMGYFGIPSADHPQPSSSRARVSNKGKRRTGVSSLQKKSDLKVDGDRGQIGTAVVHGTALGTVENQPSETFDGADKEDRAAKRARVSLDAEEDNAVDLDLTQDKLEEFIDHESSDDANEQSKVLTSSALKQQRLDQYWKQRRKNSRSAFSIHSVIYGQPKQLSAQMHHQRLLHGKSTTNILSQLFQRSVQPYSIKTRNMASYVQSGQHWNTSKTVQLDTSRINGEVSAMSFDNEGVLLATGDDRGFVRIYDFDDVNALDVRKRNELGRLRLRKSGVDEVSALSEPNGSDCTDQIQVSDDNLEDMPEIETALSKPILSFRCTSYRITDLQWNPNNQDQLAVSFAQSPEIHLYNVASSKTPLPRVTIGTLNNSSTKGREGVSVMRFVSPNLPKKKPTQILTGGSRGTVKLWLVPGLKKGQFMKDVSARCIWSVDISESNGEECSDMLVLPSTNNALADKPLVLISGKAGSLVLLNTGKCTRKSFSTTVTPTIQSTWDLYNLTARELSKQDNNIKLPTRRWMGVNKMSLLGCSCTYGISSYRISLVLNCGWVLTANLTVTQSATSTNPISLSGDHHSVSAALRVQITHQTPRIQCYNSSGERVTVLGGMALHCSLPDIPIPSSMPISSLKQMIWIGDVKPKKYTMPSKDKFVLCEQHGTITSNAPSSDNNQLRQQGDGLVLLDVTSDTGLKRISHDDILEDKSQSESERSDILARLPLVNGTPTSIVMHPTGEWMVVGYGLNGRGAAMKTLELVCMRKA